MFSVGEAVRWQDPLDADYSYGTILSIKRSVATVSGYGYYHGSLIEVPLKYMEKVERGGKRSGSNRKKYGKRSAT